MNDAKQQCGASLTNQVKSLNSSIENLVKQRVQLGSQISQLEAQVEDLKSNAIASCGRNVKQYEDELGNIKQQIAGLTAKKTTEAVQMMEQPAAATPPVPVTAVSPMTTASPATAPANATPGKQGVTVPRHR